MADPTTPVADQTTSAADPTPPAPPGRLLLLDGHSLAYRAFFALPVENFSTTTGQHTNAVYGFTSMLINVMRDEAPTHVAVAFDVSRETFRKAEYAGYKANRSTSPSEFSGQVSLVKEVLDALRIPTMEKEGFEADDVIATLATQARAAEHEVLIVSGDRDVFQLVADTTTVLYPVRGVSELTRMTPDAVEAKYGVDPPHYPDLAALVGESSDNLPGVPGVGPEDRSQVDRASTATSTAWWRTSARSRARRAESLREHLADVIRNRRVNQLIDDLDLPLSIDDLVARPWDRDAVHQVFDGLEFRVLRDRLFATLSADEPTARRGLRARGSRAAQRRGRRLAGRARRTRRPGRACTWSAAGDRAPGGSTGWLWPPAPVRPPTSTSPPSAASSARPTRPALAAWLGDPDRPKVLHDAKGPSLALAARGWPLAGLASDTALAAYLARPDQRSYDLADLTVRYLKRELRGEGTEAEAAQLALDLDEGGPDAASEAAMLRARATVDLAEALAEDLETRGGSRLLGEVELPLVAVLGDMERVGHRRRRPAPRAARGRLRGAGAAGGRRRVRGDRRADQPRLAQAAAGGAVREAADAQDQAHQDRLDHRRRGAAEPVRARPSTRSSCTCSRTATPAGCAPPSRGCARR